MRVAEFDTLFADAVHAVVRPGRTRLRWELEFTPEVAARAAELAAKENGCCSFFTFVLTVADGALSLEARVPEEHADVLDALHRRTSSVAAQP